VSEENAIVKQLHDTTKGYFEKSYIEYVLKNNDNSFDKTLAYLNDQIKNSWANKVKKQEPFSHPITISNMPPLKSSVDIPVQSAPQVQNLAQAPVPQVQSAPHTNAPQNTNGAQAHPPKQPQKKNKKVNTHFVKQAITVHDAPLLKEDLRTSPEEEYNADAKFEALQKQFENELRGIEAKRQLLTALKEEVATFTAERDSQIDTLTKEREQLCTKRKNLEQEIFQIQGRVEAIDTQVTHLKQEKVHKIRFLEEKSRTVLDDK